MIVGMQRCLDEPAVWGRTWQWAAGVGEAPVVDERQLRPDYSAAQGPLFRIQPVAP